MAKFTTNLKNYMKPSDVDITKIEYSDIKSMNTPGSRQMYINYNGDLGLIIKTPKMRLPFGISKFDGDYPKFTIGMSFDDLDKNQEIKDFYDFIKSIDDKIIKDAQNKTNSLAWLRKKSVSEDIVKTLYTPSIKRSKDKETGEFTDKYAPTFKAKLPFYDNTFKNFTVFNHDKTEIEIGDNFTELIGKNSYVSALVTPKPVWFSGGKFGITWQVAMLKLSKPRDLIGYAFMDSDSEDE